MDVVERYLENVRTYLPGGREDDLVAELRENVRAQVEDREERLGRPLTEEERIGVLRAHGHPVLVAGQYRSDGRRLVLGTEVIGPALFPFFRISVLAVAAITALVLAFGGAASLVFGARAFPYFRTAVLMLSIQLCIATAVFAALEAWFRRTSQTWDPRRLPLPARRSRTPGSLRLGAAFQIFVTVVVLWAWLAFPDPVRLLGRGFADLRTGPAWRLLYLGVLASTYLSLATPVLTLLRPDWRKYRWIVSLFSSGVFIALAGASLWNGAWVVPAGSHQGLEAVDLAVGINSGITFGLGLTVFFTAVGTVFEVARGAWREFRQAPAPGEPEGLAGLHSVSGSPRTTP